MGVHITIVQNGDHTEFDVTTYPDAKTQVIERAPVQDQVPEQTFDKGNAREVRRKRNNSKKAMRKKATSSRRKKKR